MNFLRLSYLPDDDWHGELRVSIQSDGFAGCGSAWFNRSQIEDFLTRMEPCPILAGEEPTLAGGIYAHGRLAEEALGIRITGQNATGALQVCVHLATPITAGSDQKQELNAMFLTTYADLAVFKAALAAHLAGTTPEAELPGRI